MFTMSSSAKRLLANKFIKWSTIDSQLWLKTFTVALSLMKEELGFFQSGPSSMPSTVRGNEYRTCHNFKKGFSCARTPCPYAHKCNKPGCGGDHPGIRCPTPPPPPNRTSSHPPRLGIPTVSTIAPDTVASNFGGAVAPVNVFNLQCALHSHPNRVFVNKLRLELREGARIGYTGPRQFRFSRNLPTASLNPEGVTSNLAEEVAKGHTAGPFPSPPFENFQVSPIGLVPKKHSDKFRTIFHLSFPKSGTSSINHFIDKDDFSLQYITIDKAISAIQRFGSDCFLAKTDIESAFWLFPVHPHD